MMICCFTFLLGAVPSADAAVINVKCEKRANRSKISVDGKDLAPGEYLAVVKSGGNKAVSPTAAAVGDEVEFDFDSDPGNIAAGATAIPANFIQGDVIGKIKIPGVGTVISDTVTCRIR